MKSESSGGVSARAEGQRHLLLLGLHSDSDYASSDSVVESLMDACQWLVTRLELKKNLELNEEEDLTN
jgi:hypothetical protein